jgi:Carboxypeptidase regulatory-like domain
MAEVRAAASWLPGKHGLRKSRHTGLFAVPAFTAILLCVIPASAAAQQPAVQPGILRTSLPVRPLATTVTTEGSASVTGIVLDESGASIAGADVTLLHRDGTPPNTMASEANGEFDFTKILPGSYIVMVRANGFAVFTSGEVVVTAQQVYEIPDISLALAATNIEVTVRPTDVIAAEQIRVEEKQRLVRVLPIFIRATFMTPRRSHGSRNFHSRHAARSIQWLCSVWASLRASSRRTTPFPDTGKARQDTANVLRQNLRTGGAAIF